MTNAELDVIEARHQLTGAGLPGWVQKDAVDLVAEVRRLRVHNHELALVVRKHCLTQQEVEDELRCLRGGQR